MPDRRDVLLTVDPWTAAGPGWANSGITATWRRQRQQPKRRNACLSRP